MYFTLVCTYKSGCQTEGFALFTRHALRLHYFRYEQKLFFIIVMV
jgi:hypothetical protein